MANSDQTNTKPTITDPAITDPAQVLVDIADSTGRVVGVAPRHEMRSKGLPHRATFVIQLMIDDVAPEHIDGDDPRYINQVEDWFSSVDWEDGLVLYDGAGPSPTEMLSLTADTKLVVHQRADWKDINPGYWDLAFGGVCDAGELWLPSARRELEEEAGLSDVLVAPVGAGRYVDDHGMEFAGLFIAPTTAEPVPNDGEVVAIDYVSVADLAAWCEDRPVCGDSMALVLPLLDRLRPPSE